jgi:hypothetical protein
MLTSCLAPWWGGKRQINKKLARQPGPAVSGESDARASHSAVSAGAPGSVRYGESTSRGVSRYAHGAFPYDARLSVHRVGREDLSDDSPRHSFILSEFELMLYAKCQTVNY